jgi:hypothetical protein
VDHPARWPIGTNRVELDDGELVRTGDFDEGDAVVARQSFWPLRANSSAGKCEHALAGVPPWR